MASPAACFSSRRHGDRPCPRLLVLLLQFCSPKHCSCCLIRHLAPCCKHVTCCCRTPFLLRGSAGKGRLEDGEDKRRDCGDSDIKCRLQRSRADGHGRGQYLDNTGGPPPPHSCSDPCDAVLPSSRRPAENHWNQFVVVSLTGVVGGEFSQQLFPVRICFCFMQSITNQ